MSATASSSAHSSTSAQSSSAQSSSALLVVDVQVDLIEGPDPVHDALAIVARIRQLIDRARSAGVPVVFVQDKDVAPVGSAGWQIHPALGARSDELSFPKSYSDSFYHTPLHDALQERGIRRLIVCGCTTDQCVAMTARRAVSLGYTVVLVADAHTTKDNPFFTAPQSIAYHNAMLDGFGIEDGFGAGEHEIVVQPSAQIAL